jgi:hypothetical protein
MAASVCSARTARSALVADDSTGLPRGLATGARKKKWAHEPIDQRNPLRAPSTRSTGKMTASGEPDPILFRTTIKYTVKNDLTPGKIAF